MLDYTTVKRTLIFVLALGLAGWVPEPVLACMSFSSILAECGTPNTKAPCCDGMEMNMSANNAQFVSAQDMSCCFISKAPLPESQFEVSGSSFTTASVVAPDPIVELPRVQILQPIIQVRDVSPPAFQSLLCTFLI